MNEYIPEGTISGIEPNRLGKLMADTIRAGRSALNYPGKLPESVPLLGGMGAGDIAFGQGPELAESMAHGFPPYSGSGWAFKTDPRVIDLAGTPTFGAGLVAKGAKLGGQKLMSKMIRKGTEAPFTKMYHAGEPGVPVGPGAFLNPDREAVELFSKKTARPHITEVEVDPGKAATDAEILEVVKKLGVYDEQIPIGQYLEEDLFPEAPQILDALKSQGFDSLMLRDGISPQYPSTIILNPQRIKPPVDMGRREALKKGAALAGGAAVASTGVPLMADLIRSGAGDAARVGAATAARMAPSAWVTQAVRELYSNVALENAIAKSGVDPVKFKVGPAEQQLIDAEFKRLMDETPPEYLKELEDWYTKHPDADPSIIKRAETGVTPDYPQTWEYDRNLDHYNGEAGAKWLYGDAYPNVEEVTVNPERWKMVQDFLRTGKMPEGITEIEKRHILSTANAPDVWHITAWDDLGVPRHPNDRTMWYSPPEDNVNVWFPPNSNKTP